jgi:hypothetical protein
MNRERPQYAGKFSSKAQRHGKLAHWLRRTSLMVGLSLLATSRLVSAVPISQQNVGQAVTTWVRYVTADARPTAAIQHIDPYQENGITMAYVIQFTNGGFSLAGADSLVLPVYFYSPKGTYDPKDPNCRLILKEIAQRQSYLERDAATNGIVSKTYHDELSRRAHHWDDLAAGNATTSLAAKAQGAPVPQGGPVPLAQPISSGPTSMVLPVTSLWNQNPPPYNDYCPTLPGGALPNNTNLTVVGCVATAQAQTMYYWKWPGSGVGSGTDTYNYSGTSTPLSTALANNPGIIPSDFTEHLSWANGQLTIAGWWDGSMYSQAQAFTNDIAENPAYEAALTKLYNELTPYQTALSANYTHALDWSAMQDSYTYEYTNVTSPDNSDAQVAYLDYELGIAVDVDYGVSESSSYASSIPGVLSNHFYYDPSAQDTSSDSNQMVLEIQWLRPFLVGGNDHCWMIYGYNMGTSPWQFMMNMGWGGEDNGWYTLDDVASPQLTTPTHIDDFVWDLAPLSVVGFVGASSSGNGSPSTPYQNIQQAITNAPSGATLIFQANSVNTFSSSSLVINRPLTLKGYNVTIAP